LPSYNTLTIPPGILPGDIVTLINTADTPYGNTPFKSQQVGMGYTQAVSGVRLQFQGVFSGAPSTFEVDFQEASVDNDAAYQQFGAVTTITGTNFSFDAIDAAVGPFFRVVVKTLTNSVTLTLTVSRTS
jgi:hypothetical protein